MLSLRVSKPKLRIPCFFVLLKKTTKKNNLYSNHWPLGLLSEHCIAAEAQSIYRPWETVMELYTDGTLCITFVFVLFFTRHWAMAAIHRGSQMQTKCRIQTLQVVISLLRSSMECAHWEGTVGCNPKTRGLYYSLILGLPVWLPEPQGTASILDRITYHVLLYTILFSVTNSGSR